MEKQAWAAISAALQEPFPAAQVQWRVQGKPTESGKAQILAYIDARDVQQRLDDVVGPDWSYDWQPILTSASALLIVKGSLTIAGITRSDVGDASTFEGNKGAVSDAFKRAAVHFGIGRYLYGLPVVWVALQDGRIPADTLQKLADGLERRAKAN